jgi:hypothetical protein
LASIGIIVTVPNMYRLGIGRHAADLTTHQLLYSRKVEFLSGRRMSSSNLIYSGHGCLKFSTIRPLGIVPSTPTESQQLIDIEQFIKD